MQTLYFLFFLFFFSQIFAKPVAYLYGGAGAGAQSLIQTEQAIGSFMRIKRLTAEELIEGSWKKNGALLILPGGADIPYAESLNGEGNRQIRSFVENGGALLGICAGSYYCGAYVDFGKGTESEVQGERELSFFPGIVKGPILAPYNYRTECGARAAQLFSEKEPLAVYYNGGGTFVDAGKKEGVSVLAYYDQEKQFPAVILCRVGLGKVVLSGVHLEYDPVLLDTNDPFLAEIAPEIYKTNERRLEWLHYLIELLLYY